MGGLMRLCKMYGGIKMTDNKGNTVMWKWDCHRDGARLETEMTKEDIRLSDIAKYEIMKEQIRNNGLWKPD